MNLQENIKRIKEVMGLITEQVSETPFCDSSGCKGKYSGIEFKNGIDIAHQYSNIITKAVAAKLKELYSQGDYSKVDLQNIKMTTKGCTMSNPGSPNCVYTVDIPFVKVTNKCDARTGFGHVGGWGHEGAGVDVRKKEIYNDEVEVQPKVMKRTNPVVGTINDMEHSRKSTPEGLVEYWIQWKHSNYQSDCGNNPNVVSNNLNTIEITGKDMYELRDNLKKQTKNISIDPKSVQVDIDNYKVTFNIGNQKIGVISLLFDNEGQMENRLDKIKVSNPTLKVIEKGKKNNFEWVVSLI